MGSSAQQRPGRTLFARAFIGLAALVWLAGLYGCGAEGSMVGRSSSFSTLVAGGPVSPVPTSSPEVVCIRAVTAALRAVVEDGVPPRRAATGLAKDYGSDGPVTKVFFAQLPAYRRYASDRGADIAGAMVWPALEAACS